MRGALLALLALEAVVVAVSIFAATQYVELPGVTAVHAAGGRVYVAVGHDVLMADEAGNSLGAVQWRFGRATSMTTTDDGHLLVADGERGEVVRFTSLGTGGQVLPLSRQPRLNFELAALPGGRLAVAATMDHAVWIFDAQGQLTASTAIRYPNGLAFSGGTVPLLYVVETGARRIHALNLALEVVQSDEVDALRATIVPWMKQSPRPQLLGGTLSAKGEYALFVCRGTQGDCDLVRSTPAGPRAVASLSRIYEDEAAADPLLLLVAEVAELTNGALVIASPRLARALMFDAPFADATPYTFGADIPPPDVDVVRVERGELAGAMGLRVFGDAELQRRFANQHGARRLFARAEAASRIVAGLLLVVLLVLFARNRLELRSGQSRLATLWRELLRPELPDLARGFAALAVAGTVAAVPGLLLSSLSLAVVAVSVTVAFISAKWIGPWLLRRRSRRVARATFALYVSPDEPAQDAFFAETSGTIVEDAADLLEAADRSAVLDLLDSVEALFPRGTLIAVTAAHVYCVEVGVLGLPSGPIARWRRANAGGVRSIRIPRRRRSVVIQPPVIARSASIECHVCRSSTGCAHVRATFTPPVLFTLLLPGLGHLVQGRFARGRAAAVLAITALLDAVGQFLPQYVGTLPYAPRAYEVPLLVYSALMFATLLDVSFEALRRTAFVATPPSTAAEKL